MEDDDTHEGEDSWMPLGKAVSGVLTKLLERRVETLNSIQSRAVLVVDTTSPRKFSQNPAGRCSHAAGQA